MNNYDDMRYFRFERNTGLPRGTFGRVRRPVDRFKVVVVLGLICMALVGVVARMV